MLLCLIFRQLFKKLSTESFNNHLTNDSQYAFIMYKQNELLRNHKMSNVNRIIKRFHDALTIASKDLTRCHARESQELFENMLNKSLIDDKYKIEFDKWILGVTSTIALRELANPFRMYWKSLYDANIIDELDSISLHVKCSFAAL